MNIEVIAEEFLPIYKHDNDAGADLKSMINIIVRKGKTVLIPTGIKMSIPEGYEGQIRPRSGLALKNNVRAILGTIDSSYRGEVGVIFNNFGEEDFIVKKGDRIAQIVFNKITHADFIITDKLNNSIRNEKGFGSSGV